MTNIDYLNPFNSTKLIAMDNYFNEMISLYNIKKFPKVLLLNGKKGIGKFTLVIHFLNYIFSAKEKEAYILKDKTININSIFYKQLLSNTNQDILLIKAEENKNIKIEDIRNLKSTISRSSLSDNPRFIIIDEVEHMNENSVNALLKSLEEPSVNNYFILINNKQAELIKTVTSRCLISNIFLNQIDAISVVNYLLDRNNIESLIDFNSNLTPGSFLRFNEIYLKLNLSEKDNISIRINKLLTTYKKTKDKLMIDLSLYLIDQYFLNLIQLNETQLDSLIKIKSSIVSNINDFIYYNLNINSVLNSIEMKLNNV
jgi:DNA polymerase III subunit delta'|tara:strand:- start:67 stop:1008 length:942 start_codon:yes stop_codon:yes gene_type:complete